MNSANEGLAAEVLLILYPQTAEQGGVARRVVQLNAGILLKENSPAADPRCRESGAGGSRSQVKAQKISASFARSGGPRAAWLIEN